MTDQFNLLAFGATTRDLELITGKKVSFNTFEKGRPPT